MNIGLIVGIAIAISISTYRNEKMVREYREKQKLEKLKQKVDIKLESPTEEIKKEEIKKLEKENKKKKKND